MKRFLLLVLVPLCSFGEEVLYVQSIKAKLLAEPVFTAPVVAEVERGVKVIQIENQGRWSKITADSHSGWVSRFLLSEQQPIPRVTVLDGKDQEIDTNVRRRASVVTTAGAARGLAAEDRNRSGHQTRSNYHALEWMESVNVNEAEVAQFVSEGLNQ